MPTFIEYDLGNGATILVESLEEAGSGAKKAGLGESKTIKAKKKFEEILKDVRVQSKLLLKEIGALEVGEAEIKFGLSAAAELGGSMFIGKVGGSVNYEITLKWKKIEEKK